MASLLDSLVNNQPQAPQNMGLLAQLTSQPQAELRSYSPPLRQRILDYLIGDNRPSQAKSSFMQGLVGISDWTPIGVAYALDDMQRSLRAGDQQGAQLAALGVVPGIRPAGKIAQKVAGAVEREIPQGIRAYHGSPHDFDKFDISKIGTGEGAQAYGHGLYFADNPAVARQYKQALERRNISATWDGKPIDSWPNLVDRLQKEDWRTAKIVDELGRIGGDPFVYFRDQRNWYRNQPDMIAALDAVEQRMTAKHTPGKMYEVNINARPDQFLDWDKPLKEQGGVGEIINRLLDKNPDVKRNLQNNKWTGGPPTGENLFGAYSEAIPLSQRYSPRMSQDLLEAGIPGIRYLDQGSRGTGQGTSNYVVFNDSLIDILRKYGLAGATATGVVAGATQTPSGDVY